MNTVGYFEIQSPDPARERCFYETVFRWKFIREENFPVEYYRIVTGAGRDFFWMPIKIRLAFLKWMKMRDSRFGILP